MSDSKLPNIIPCTCTCSCEGVQSLQKNSEISTALQSPSQQASEAGWKGTAVKVTLLVALLAAAGYGLYWYGASQASQVAGENFEKIITEIAKTEPAVREKLFSDLKNAGELLGSISAPSPIQTVLPGGSSAVASTVTNTLTTLHETAVGFGGKLAEGFAKMTYENTPGPNLDLSGQAQKVINRIVEPLVEEVNGIVTTIKYTGISVAVTAGTVALGYFMRSVAQLRGRS